MMNNADVIKALDRCGYLKDCADCPLNGLGGIDKCIHTLMQNALDLINRQQAEIERLTGLRNSDPMDFCGVLCKYSEELIKKAKSETRKEFAERIKATFPDRDDPRCTDDDIFTLDSIDNLLKELDGEENNDE